MPSLIELAKTDPGSFAHYSIEQIVAICGDGRLRDSNQCSEQLRTFLAFQTPSRLAVYAQHCLDNRFDKGGMVLQDVVNEIGRRLGYEVTNGLYQGRVNAIGFDGLWTDGDDELIIEVKTTDAYRINLDTIFKYSTKLETRDGDSSPKRRTSLIVVGRQDTGDLEAQIRGSRHAWTTRLVSIGALAKLMFVNSELEDPTLTNKIRKILLPFEYTRVDNIVDLVFETQQESDADAVPIPTEKASTETSMDAIEAFTPRAAIDKKRAEIIRSFFASRSMTPQRISKTNFSNDSGTLHVTCAISKNYENPSPGYWYALHPAWVEFMKESSEGYFILGCMDSDEAYAIPLSFVESVTGKLNLSVKKDGKHYWHIALGQDQGALKWNMSKVGEKVDLRPFMFRIRHAPS